MAIDDLQIAGVQSDELARSTSGVRTLIPAALHTRRGRIGGILAATVVAVAIIGPFVAPHAPNAFVTGAFAKASSTSPLGGDVLGRDVLSRVLAGGWLILLAAAAATALGIVSGTAVGLVSAFEGGPIDTVLMRGNDVLLAFPQIVLALLVISVIGSQVWIIVLVVGIGHMPQVARVVRAVTLDVAERDFVKAEELMGISRRRIMVSEVLPHLTSVLMVEIGLRFTYSIIIISGLSFLGFGLQPPAPNWGSMINENRIGLSENPWATLAPILILVLLTIGVNLFTDAVARVSLGIDRHSVDRGLRRRRRTEPLGNG